MYDNISYGLVCQVSLLKTNALLIWTFGTTTILLVNENAFFVTMTIKTTHKTCKMKTYLRLVLCILFPEQWMHKVIVNIEVIQFKS